MLAWRQFDAHGLVVFAMIALMLAAAGYLGFRDGLRRVTLSALVFTLGLGSIYVLTGTARRGADRPECSLDTLGFCRQDPADQFARAFPAAVVIVLAGALGAAVRTGRDADRAALGQESGTAR